MISYLWMVMNWKTNLPRHSHKFGLIWHRIIPKKIQRFFCNNKLIFHIGKSINYTSGFQFCLLFSAKKNGYSKICIWWSNDYLVWIKLCGCDFAWKLLVFIVISFKTKLFHDWFRIACSILYHVPCGNDGYVTILVFSPCIRMFNAQHGKSFNDPSSSALHFKSS